MTIQLSDCCKAPIDLNPKLDRPECYTCIECGRVIGSPLTDTNHTDSVEAKNTAIHLTATLDTEVFKGRYSSSTLETIEAIIKRELTTLQVHTSQQIEEAVLQADATGAYHSGYLAGKAEVEEAVRKGRVQIIREVNSFSERYPEYGVRLYQWEDGSLGMDTITFKDAVNGKQGDFRPYLYKETPNHQD